MFKLDKGLLATLGLANLPPSAAKRLLAWIYETLESRVGMTLAERMTSKQLDEFAEFIDNDDEAGALSWLQGNFPDYQSVVAERLREIKDQLRQRRSDIRQLLLETDDSNATGVGA